MNVKFKVLEINPDEHSIVVRYYTDKITEEILDVNRSETKKREDGSPLRCRTDYNINIPVPAPENEELMNYLSMNAPRQWLELQENILDPNVDTTLKHALDLVGKEHVAEVATKTQEVLSLTEKEILDLIEKTKKS
jgi:hypothetical protein